MASRSGPVPADGRAEPPVVPTRDRVVRGLLTGVIAIAAGVAVAVSPLSLGVIGGSMIAIWLVAIGRGSIAVFHGALVALLIGYAFLGKGFAYFGLPPLYVGEMCLALAVVAILYSIRQARFSLPLLFLVLFMAWGLLRTVPYVGTYGLFAIRDGVTWEYGLFAIAVALTVRREHVDRVVGLYRRGALLLVWWMPVAAILTIRFAASLPKYPGSPVPVVFYKAGDSGVQLAGIAAFVLLGLYSARDTDADPPDRAVVRLVHLGRARGPQSIRDAGDGDGRSLLSCSCSPSLALLSLAFVGSVFAVMLLTVNPEVDLGLSRNVSITQLITNLGSITGSDDAQLDASKDWRLAWWNKIYGYTVDGPYFWVGKGFGVNLATQDGFQVDLRADAPGAAQRAPRDPGAGGCPRARPLGAVPVRLRQCRAQGRGDRATDQRAGMDPAARLGLRVLAGRAGQRLVRRLPRRSAGRHLVLVHDRSRSGVDPHGQRTGGKRPAGRVTRSEPRGAASPPRPPADVPRPARSRLGRGRLLASQDPEGREQLGKIATTCLEIERSVRTGHRRMRSRDLGCHETNRPSRAADGDSRSAKDARAAAVEADDRKARRDRLDDRERPLVVEAREDKDIGLLAHDAHDFVPRLHAPELDPVGDPETTGEAP